jgi:pyruvate dehydrogenase E1 component subunit alpha
VINNQFGMGTSLERHSAVTDLSQKSEGYGVPGVKCDGMDVLDVHAVISEALEKARKDRKPQLVEAVTYRYRGHSMADPEEYRSKEEVEEWRERDPINNFRKRVVDADVLSDDDIEKLDQEAQKTVDEAVDFADKSPHPDLASLYDDVYVMEGDAKQAWWLVDERSPETHRGEEEREAGKVAQELAEAGAAYAGEDVTSERRSRTSDNRDHGEGEPAEGTRDDEGGGD